MSGVDIYGPIFTGGTWSGNYGMTDRSASFTEIQYLVQANPYQVPSSPWDFYAGWTYTDYNPDQVNTLHVISGVVTWSATNGQHYTAATHNFNYDLSPQTGCGNAGWLKIRLDNTNYSGWTTFQLHYSGLYRYGNGGAWNAFSVTYSHLTNLQWN